MLWKFAHKSKHYERERDVKFDDLCNTNWKKSCSSPNLDKTQKISPLNWKWKQVLREAQFALSKLSVITDRQISRQTKLFLEEASPLKRSVFHSEYAAEVRKLEDSIRNLKVPPGCDQVSLLPNQLLWFIWDNGGKDYRTQCSRVKVHVGNTIGKRSLDRRA